MSYMYRKLWKPVKFWYQLVMVSHLFGGAINLFIKGHKSWSSTWHYLITGTHELDHKVKSMMTKSQNMLPNGHQRADICTVYGKEGKNIRDHIESNHLEGISIPCSYCEKTFRSWIAPRKHLSKEHKLSLFSNTGFILLFQDER